MGLNYDWSGWLTVDGPRFGAFAPLGSKVMLEYDILFLMEAYNQPYDSIMAMPSSRRHRIVKMRAEIVRQAKDSRSGQTTVSSGATGINPMLKGAVPHQSVNIGYNK